MGLDPCSVKYSCVGPHPPPAAGAQRVSGGVFSEQTTATVESNMTAVNVVAEWSVSFSGYKQKPPSVL